MSISATAIDKRSSHRFMLVRLKPARHATNLFAAVGGDYYEATFEYPVASVEIDGEVRLKTTPTTFAADNFYNYNQSTQTLRLHETVDPTSRVVVVYFYLFYTTGIDREAYETPTDSSTTLRCWEGRLKEMPEIKQSIRDLLSGIISIDAASLAISNVDNSFQAYLSENDSFYQKDVDIWLGIDTTSDLQLIYKGRIDQIGLDKDSVTVRLFDALSSLSQPCLMGDSTDWAYFNRRAGSSDTPTNTLVDATKDRSPCPFYFGSTTPFKTKVEPSLSGHYRIDWESLPEAVCIALVAISTTTNRQWGLGRIGPDGLDTYDLGTRSSLTISGDTVVLGYSVGNWPNVDVEIGTTCKLSQTAKTTRYGRVTKIDSSAREIHILCTSTPDYTHAGAVIDVASLDHSVQIYIADNLGVEYPCYGERDYTVSTNTTDGANKFVYIEFTNNFETNFAFSTLTPGEHRVLYRFKIDNTGSHPSRHTTAVRDICLHAGLIADSDSLSESYTALPVNVQFSIPSFQETDYNSYLKYLEMIVSSTLAYLIVNGVGEVEYHLLQAPSGSATIDKNTMVVDSLSIDVDYKDIITEVIAYNQHKEDERSIDADSSPSETRSNSVAHYLHGIKNIHHFVHVLESITDRIDDILAYLSKRKATYRFKTVTQHVDAEIGDDLKLDVAQVLGSNASPADLKIISLAKDGKTVEVEATDLLGL